MLAILGDAQLIVREAIARVISETQHIDVLQADDASHAVALCRSHNPDLVLLELMMPGLDSFSAAEEIRRLRPRAKIAILTRQNHISHLIRARKMRLNAFILKRDRPEELFYAIRTINSGGFYVPPSLSEGLRDHFLKDPSGESNPLDLLTPRETAVLALYAQGLSIKEIACKLDVSVKTAETHRNNFGRKLGHPNRSQVTALALAHHMVSEEQLLVAAG